MEVRMTSRRVFLATLAFAAAAAVVAAADFNGEWTASIETQIGVQNYTFSFKVDGEKLTGRAKSAFANADTEITEGVVKGDDITFVENLVYRSQTTFRGEALQEVGDFMSRRRGRCGRQPP
jgi:uncharacterized protein (DUF2141 family)